MRTLLVLSVLLAASPLAAGQDDPATDQLRYARALSDAFNGAAERIDDSVVHITTRKEHIVRRRDFFGRPLRPRRHLESGLGSGVVISEDGHILTNNHVVEDADELMVRLIDGRETPARLVGTDAERDLAVVKIEESGLVPAEFGDSDALRIGEWVLAVGSPFGFSNTVTAGIVSARGPTTGPVISELSKFEDYIQTDAAINPGNSGGPLINLDGRVVGINTAIFSRTGGSVGIGFAIPANLAREVADEIISTVPPARGWLGVEMQELTQDLAETFGIERDAGVLIASVVPGGPADRAGLGAGDIVTSVGADRVRSNRDLVARIHETPPGTSAPLTVLRDARELTIDVAFGDLDAYLAERYGAVGIEAETVTESLARDMGYRPFEGVVVTRVDPGGAADRSGLIEGDIILEIGGDPIANTSELDATLRDADLVSGVRLRVIRDGRRGYLVLGK